MPKQYISYQVSETNTEKQEIIIAMLQDFGFDGFEQTPDQLIANGFAETLDVAGIELYLAEIGTLYTKNILDEENWNQKWESSFEPIVIDHFCAIRASFHQPIPGVQHEIVITPKMSFGTGHHATTWMMLKAMETILFTQKAVIDFGTGTGILAILAEKMGAEHIEALDYDEWCIENGSENIAANHCNNIHLYQAANLHGLQPVDILLANINKNVILENFTDLAHLVLPTGVLVISGILVEDEADILAAAEKVGLQQIQKQEKSGWLCINFKAVA